jgi:hypothetical protein
LQFATTPVRATVTRLDTGQRLGETPLALELPPSAGEVLFRIEAPGFDPIQRTLALDRDRSVDLALVSRPAPARPKTGRKKK